MCFSKVLNSTEQNLVNSSKFRFLRFLNRKLYWPETSDETTNIEVLDLLIIL